MFRLMLITDRRLSERPPVQVVREAVAGGVEAVQVREKDMTAGELFALVKDVLKQVARAVPVLVNGRVEVALMAGANGVHLGGEPLEVRRARGIAPRDLLIGYSAHSVEEAAAAEEAGADYVTLSPVFQTSCKPAAAPIGLGLLTEAARRLRIPVLALGGIGPDNATEVAGTGARGIAVISSIYAAEAPAEAAAAVLAAFTACREEPG